MPLFRVATHDRQGRSQISTVAAQNEKAAVRQLQARGFFITNVTRVHRPPVINPFPGIRAALWPIRPQACALFFGHLAELMRGAISLTEALRRTAQRTADHRLAAFARRAAEDTARGIPLSEVMALDHYTFEPYVHAAVAAAEQAGAVDTVFELLEDEFRSRDVFARRFTVCSIYARAVLVGGIIVATIPTVFSLGLKGWLTNLAVYGSPVLVAGILLWYLLRAIRNFPPVKAAWEHLLLLLPVCGELLHSLAGLRASRCLRALFEAGVPPETAFETAAPACGHWWMERGMLRGARVARAGARLAEAFRASRVFSRRAVGLVATGEQAGVVAEMLRENCEDYDRRTRDALLRCTFWGWALLMFATAGIVVFCIYLGAQEGLKQLNEALYRVFGEGFGL